MMNSIAFALAKICLYLYIYSASTREIEIIWQNRMIETESSHIYHVLLTAELAECQKVEIYVLSNVFIFYTIFLLFLLFVVDSAKVCRIMVCTTL